MIRQYALHELAGALARVWFRYAAPKRYQEHTYVGKRWVRVTVEFNGEITIPQRRAEDRAVMQETDVAASLRLYLAEADYLAPETDERQRRADATKKRLDVSRSM